MPSASRPFTAEMIARLVVRGVTIAPITLHTGVSSLEGDEEPYPEPYDIPPATARLVDVTRQDGGRRQAARGGRPAARVRRLDAPRGDTGNPPEGGGCAVHRAARTAIHPPFDAERIRRG